MGITDLQLLVGGKQGFYTKLTPEARRFTLSVVEAELIATRKITANTRPFSIRGISANVVSQG